MVNESVYRTNKDEYLNFVKESYSESILNGYKMVFKKILPYEKQIDKDLRDFNLDELFQVLELLRGRSYNSVHTKWSLVRKYLTFYNNSYVSQITSKDIKNYISEVETRYITREELREKVKMAGSDSHKALLFLLFDGVGGLGYKDICNLKYSDIDFEKGVVTIGEDTYELSKDTLEYLKRAEKETTVTKFAISDDNTKSDDEYQVNPNSPYVFKTRMIKSTENGMTPYRTTGLQRRLDSLTKMLGMDHQNGKTLYYSGLVEKYLKLEKKFGKRFSINDIVWLADSVGIKTLQANTLYRAMEIIRKQVRGEFNGENTTNRYFS